MKINIVLITVVYIVFHTTSVNSKELDFAVKLELASQTNVLQEPNPQSDELSETIRGTLFFNENTSDLIATVNLSAEAINYQDNIADDYNQVDLYSNALWSLSLNHYEWFLQNIFTHTAVDPFLINTADNRQYVNAFSTGPNIIWRFGSINSIRLQPRIENYRYENDVRNNNRLNTALQWIHSPSKNISYTLSNRLEQIKYSSSNVVDSDFEQYELDLRLAYTKNRSTYEVEGGIIKIMSDSQENNSETQYAIILNNQRTNTSAIVFELRKSVTDTSSLISSTSLTNNDLLTTSNDLFINDVIQIDYSKSFRQSEWMIGISKGSDDYFIENSLDRDINSAYLQARWINARNSAIRIQFSKRELNYTEDVNNRVDNDYIGLFNYTYRTNKFINYVISIETIERESTIIQESFEDKRILFSVEFTTRKEGS